MHTSDRAVGLTGGLMHLGHGSDGVTALPVFPKWHACHLVCMVLAVKCSLTAPVGAHIILHRGDSPVMQN